MKGEGIEQMSVSEAGFEFPLKPYRPDKPADKADTSQTGGKSSGERLGQSEMTKAGSR